ncbi:MAG TPA: aminotransferase class V-fold PLP-dependent enzyme [Polyangiaceae bacterium]|jgi:2-aminoethylphosphonate-pyruvate transaminase|nr:aminotransferase class V-fold PLP-dependent enzyme [Polyangiaceae bacterium]
MSPTVVSLTPAVFHLPDAVNAVARAYGARPLVPRGPAFAPLVHDVRRAIQDALDAPGYEPVLMTGTGSTAMAAVLGSCLEPKEKLLVVRNGAYGDRILEFAKTIGQPVVDMSLEYGARPDLAAIDRLCASGDVDAVAIVYGATSTCSLNPVREVGEITKSRGKKLLVDGVSALFVEPMDLEGWGIDAVMGSCNKGLHSHPNLTMAVVKKELAAELDRIRPRAPSLELGKILKAQKTGSHPYTIDPMSVMMVKAALGALAEEGGVAGRNAIYLARCELLRAAYERLGLTIARWEAMPLSSIGTALEIPAGTSYEELAQRLSTDEVEGHVFEIYAAQGKLSSKLFRIFHMGHYPLGVYEVFARALAKALGRG